MQKSPEIGTFDARPRRYINTGDYISALSVLREDEIDLQKLSDCSVLDGLKKYRSQLAEDSYFDFSAQLDNAVTELEGNSELRSRVAARVKYVVVDEYQDVNPIQERLVRLLHDLGAGLCVVGDDDQTIYQWRGSSVGNILEFKNNYPGVKQIRLEENFRSSEGVIDAARRFVAKVSQRLPKAMKFSDAQSYEPGDVVALTFDSPEEEARHIAESLKSLHGVAFEDGDGERGLSWSDMAVLLRSVKANGTIIKEALKSAEIPFVVTGLANLFETDEASAARDLFHYISGETINGVKPPNDRALRQSWQTANLGFAKRKLGNALRYAKQVRDVLHGESEENPPSIQAVFLTFLEIAELREEVIPGTRGRWCCLIWGNLAR